MGSGRALVAQPHARHAVPGRSRLCRLCALARGGAAGAQLLWRMPKNLILPVEKMLDDGSYLSTLYPSAGDRKKGINGIAVRVIEYALPQVPDSEPMYRLLTTLHDTQEAPASLLAALYHERWEVELVFDELKTRLVQRRRVLRSKTPELVRQEFYGWMMAHYAVRWLMYQGARQAGIHERSLSFVANVHLLRRSLPQAAAIPPACRKKWYRQLFDGAATLLCESSRGRIKPRMVKRRNSPCKSHQRPRPASPEIDFTPKIKPPNLSK